MAPTDCCSLIQKRGLSCAWSPSQLSTQAMSLDDSSMWKKQFLDRGLFPTSFNMWVVLARMLGPAIVVLISVYLRHKKVPSLVLTVMLWYPMLCHTRTVLSANRQKLQQDIIIFAPLHPGYPWILLILCVFTISHVVQLRTVKQLFSSTLEK